MQLLLLFAQILFIVSADHVDKDMSCYKIIQHGASRMISEHFRLLFPLILLTI